MENTFQDTVQNLAFGDFGFERRDNERCSLRQCGLHQQEADKTLVAQAGRVKYFRRVREHTGNFAVVCVDEEIHGVHFRGGWPTPYSHRRTRVHAGVVRPRRLRYP